MPDALFPVDVPSLQWGEFPAAGFRAPVSGVVYTSDQPPCCGVPLGGLATGCVDLDARGVWGWSSLFNPVSAHPTSSGVSLPRRHPEIVPVLGLGVGGKTWVLASAQTISGGALPWCTEPFGHVGADRVAQVCLPCPTIDGVEAATRVRLWGHYPVADFQYETTAPVTVAMRAWAPFIPGDAAASNIPAAILEIRVHNPSSVGHQVTIALDFPGPNAAEAGAVEVNRVPVNEGLQGMLVSAPSGVDYLLAALRTEGVRFGSGLSARPSAWSRIASELPRPASREERGVSWYRELGCSVAVDLDLGPGQSDAVRIILAWHAPVRLAQTRPWAGREVREKGVLRHRWVGDEAQGDAHHFTHMYAARFGSSLEAARHLAAAHERLLARVLSWQSAIYGEPGLPTWLRDSLVNNLALVAETGHWVQARAPLGDWAFPGGAFALDESPRSCPHMACIPCDWYGNLPIVFFFPELARSTLRAFREYQSEDGEIPFALGKIDLPDFAVPEYHWQVSLNGFCFTDMVDRLWQTTGDDAVLAELYPAVKRATAHAMGLSDKPAPALRMPDIGGMEWFEYGEWAGMATHAGGLRLSGLLMVERMARARGDEEFAARCRSWFDDGSRALETELWAGSYYLNYLEPETGKKSDDVMGYQLDGEWAARYHGLDGVFRADRVTATLGTILRCNVALTPEVGAANFARPDGGALASGSQVASYGTHAMFPPELLVLAMTCMQAGERETGLELARRMWSTLCLAQRHPWDLPNIVDGQTGKRRFGTDYYQNMMLWALPGVLAGETLADVRGPRSLVRRVIEAGR